MLTRNDSIILSQQDDVQKRKLTAKHWAKLAKVSPDTAVRDVQHLAEIGVLIPEEGKVRNIPDFDNDSPNSLTRVRDPFN
jgi:Fic family protein